jgi:P27 family predicted phage terminase small subunit
LSAEARAVWRQVVAEQPPSLILRADTFVLESFCCAMVEYRRSLEVYRRSPVPGLIAARGDGRRSDNVVVHPALRALRHWGVEVRTLARDLGLSPSARASMHLDGSAGIADSIEDRIGPAPRFRVMAGTRADDALP